MLNKCPWRQKLHTAVSLDTFTVQKCSVSGMHITIVLSQWIPFINIQNVPGDIFEKAFCFDVVGAREYFFFFTLLHPHFFAKKYEKFIPFCLYSTIFTTQQTCYAF